MKISFVVVKNIKTGGGIERYSYELGSRLNARGHQVTVYSMKHYGNNPGRVKGIRVIGVPSLPFRHAEKITASVSSLLGLILRERPDIVHFHSIVPGCFAWMLRCVNVPYVLQMHGIEWKRTRWGRFGSNVLRLLERAACRQAGISTAVSKVQCDYFTAKYGLDVRYIPTGAQIRQRVSPHAILKLGLKPRSYIFFASRLVSEKGAHYLIPAFKGINTECKLVIAGDASGEKQYKKELYKLAGGDPRIIFPGYVQGQLLDELFSNARLYVQPSEVEGLSIALLEAMSYGNVCLVSDIPENMEATQNTGLSFESKNIGDLQQKLEWALTHPGETATMGTEARERIEEHFCWDSVTDQIEQLYDEASGSSLRRGEPSQSAK